MSDPAQGALVMALKEEGWRVESVDRPRRRAELRRRFKMVMAHPRTVGTLIVEVDRRGRQRDHATYVHASLTAWLDTATATLRCGSSRPRTAAALSTMPDVRLITQ